MDLYLRNSRIRLPQGQMFWREIGQGSVLVFLHGFSRDSSQWLPVIEHLSENYHCFAPDLLGFGDSEHPNVHYSIEWQGECLASYLEALNLRQVYLIGHSLGGWIATSYTLKHLEHLKHLDQVHGLVLLAPEGIEIERQWEQRLWVRLLVGRPPIIFWLLRSLLPLAGILGFQEKIQHSLEYRKQLLRSPATYQLLFQRRRAEIQAELLQERLEWLAIPTLILQGGQDTPANIAQSQAYADLVPTAKLHIINNGGNDLPEAMPDLIAQEIREFVTASRER